MPDANRLVVPTMSDSRRPLRSGLFQKDVTAADFHQSSGSAAQTVSIDVLGPFTGHVPIIRDVWFYIYDNWGSAVTLSAGSSDGSSGDADAFVLAQNASLQGFSGIAANQKGVGLSSPSTQALGGSALLLSADRVTLTCDAGSGQTTNDLATNLKMRVFIKFDEVETPS